MPAIRKSPVIIVAADDVSLAGAELLPPKKFSVISDTGLNNDMLFSKYSDADVLLIRSTRKIGRRNLIKSNVKVIATFTKGTDHIDMTTADNQGVIVFNAEEGNHISAAEHTLALILGIAKNLIEAVSRVRQGRFEDIDFRRTELHGKTIGIIGFGKVGSYVGKLCGVFGMEVLANDIDRSVKFKNKEYKFCSLQNLLRKSDFVSLHIPYNERNRKFFNRNMFSMMRKDSVLINTSRGKVVDEQALLEVLEKGRIYFAGLDVFASEPKVNKRFMELRNVLLTNHIAGKTIESRDRISYTVFAKILNHFERPA